MKVLLDHDLPKQLRLLLRGHLALTARQMSWDELSNGRLIAVAQAQGFDILLTADKRMFQQQQHVERKISIILLSTPLMVHLQPQVGLISDAIERGPLNPLRFPNQPTAKDIQSRLNSRRSIAYERIHHQTR
jgi:predicted nuclease of predicted toxin-antitoxin system